MDEKTCSGDFMKKQSEFICYRRILELDKLISLGSYPSTAKLAEKLEVSGVSIKRDIERMRLVFDAPIKYDKLHEGWYYENPVFRLPALFVNEKQMIAAVLTKKMVESLHGTSAYDSAKELLCEMTQLVSNPLSNTDVLDTSWIDSRIVFLEDCHEPAKSDIWQTVTECLHHDYELNFLYKGLQDNDYGQRRVRPYQLLNSMNMWTLWAYDINSKRVRLFRLNRMKNVICNKKKFVLPDDFDYRTKNTGNFGVWSSDRNFNFQITYYAFEATIALERYWSVDQKLQQHDDGSVTVTFSGSQFEPVLSHVLSCGMNAVPQKPIELVDAWKDTIRTIARKCLLFP